MQLLPVRVSVLTQTSYPMMVELYEKFFIAAAAQPGLPQSWKDLLPETLYVSIIF